jgi:hypothetical protein
MKVYSLLLELKSYPAAGVTDRLTNACKDSNLEAPRDLEEAWVNGEYDEDPEVLVQELETELKMNKLL